MTESFDFIVVGAGSAGCVLANRLSADPGYRVLLVEAGPRDWNPLIRVPIMAGRFYRRRSINWFYETEPQARLDGRRILWPRGKVLGGSSAINGMIYARGHREDFDGWAQTGLLDWSYERVLPYFRRSERREGGADEFHGGDGPLPVTRPPGDNRLYDAFIAAGTEAGYPQTPDFNGAEQEGVGRYDYNIRNGQRWSAARAFLAPIRHRPNLTILTGAHLLRVTLEGTRATGVELLAGARRCRYRAEREVVLSGGAVGSPAALLHSGIGDADALRRVGVEPRIDLKSVGRNLQDHLQLVVSHATDHSDGIYEFRRVDRAVLSVAQSLLMGTGTATTFPTLAGAFLRSSPAVSAPDIQIHFIMGAGGYNLRHPFARKPAGYQGSGFNGSVCQLRPESRGTITLRSADPLAPPAIDPNYLAAETDRRAFRDAFRMMREIFRQKAFDPYRGRELSPGPEVRTDADIDRFMARSIGTIFHPVGSCRMGADPDSVVDGELRVRGAERLRVIDASVMPRIVGANTHAATVMIAERGADFILGRTCEPVPSEADRG